mgnify:CR=1 FL=1
MKLLDGDKLKKHLDYLIQKEKQLAKECSLSPNNEFERQRRYCFEANALAYGLCENVMDYYLVTDTQVMNQWISVDDKLPDINERVFVYIPRPNNHYNIEIAYISEGNDDHPYWVLRDESQFYSTRFHYISHWMSLPEPPKGSDTEEHTEVNKPDGNCLDCKFQYLEDSDYWCSVCPGNPEDI